MTLYELFIVWFGTLLWIGKMTLIGWIVAEALICVVCCFVTFNTVEGEEIRIIYTEPEPWEDNPNPFYFEKRPARVATKKPRKMVPDLRGYYSGVPP